ncbi:MFS transporter [Brachybacterium phenoliresistens]|uniref:MFS transporter n=1 Tax=Brachybacterium phenoliresistens TaxID=396014 RepID=Z9JRB0_9MICO|nr:MFS transporter [Brachybacterium phenoliresistens]EWS80518.1 MFS transporter [Brachybacterium phenoliresistens]
MTSTRPETGFPPDPTIDLQGSPNLIGPRLPIPHLGITPDAKRPAWFIGGVFLAQFGLFVALLGPATVSIALKAQTLASSPAEQAAITALALSPGAIAAVIFNALGGRISDRTTSRFGRRRPWIIGGIVAMSLALLLIATATGPLTMGIGWFLAQACANMAFAAFLASVSDQLPSEQYGKTSGIIGIAQNVGIMVATWLAAFLESNMLLLFMVPAVLGAVLMAVYALMLPEPVLKENRHPFNLRELISTFWTNPIRFPDFGLAWWGRFLIILASYLFVVFRVQYMTDHLGLPTAEATKAVATGVTIYTIVSMFASFFAGWLSDRIGKRKVIVAGAILVFGIGTYMLLHADTVTAFYLCEAVMGLAYGAYVAVDLALVLDVLPDRENAGKDLGVFNMANALPQSLAGGLGGFLLARIGGGTDFTALLVAALVSAVIGAVITMLIRGVK